MTLPSSFGAILLGEMFSSCLCVNNEVGVDIEDVTVKVEMQTVSTKILLFETQASKLAAGDTADFVIQHEIKELGQHVLGCTVIYRSPGDSRHIAPGEENALLRDFSKFYKFNVCNTMCSQHPIRLILLLSLGDKPTFSKDEGPYSSSAPCDNDSSRTGHSFPRNPRAESYTKSHLV